MIRIKHILSILFLVVATLVTAQESYVIDSVCVDSYRTYRLDGQEGSDYKWDIFRSVDGSIFADSVSYNIYMDIDRPAAGDTTWGSEIVQLWDEIGEFDIEVTHWSEHGCDTFEIGKIKVFPVPEAKAGPDDVICELADIVVSGDTAWNNSTLFWTSTGDGTFSDNTQLHPTYYLGSNDSLTNNITLILTAYGLADNGTCTPAVDSVNFNFSSPDIAFTVQEILCYNDNNAAITATITDGLAPYSFSWTGPSGYVSSGSNNINGLGAGIYVLTVTDGNGCFDIDSVEIINPDELLLSIDDVQHVSCYGYADGFILASAVGGTGNLTYNWTGPSGYSANNDSIYNLAGGIYKLTVSDENGCFDTISAVVDEPELLLANIIVNDSELCEGDNEVIFGTTVGGTGIINHAWTGSGAAYLSATNVIAPSFIGAPVGKYSLIYIIRDEAGCEARDTLEINVYPPSYSFEEWEVCANAAPVSWNSRTILSDADRTYRDTLVNQWGCDSLLTLEVDVLFPVYDDTTIYVCENKEPFVVYNQTIWPDRDSIYLDTVPYIVSGCDSLLITVNVFTLPVTDTLLDSILCAGADEFVWNNVTILTEHDSIYLDTLVNSFGCDSLLTYDVTIVPPDTFYVDTTFCQDEPEFVWNGLTILTQNDSIYEATLANRFGCDSIVNLNVHLLPVTDTTIDTMLCYNTPAYAWNNLVIYAEHDSTYLDTLVNQWGCDSLLTLNVTIMFPDTVTIDTTICEGEPVFAWGVNTIHQVDSYADSMYTDILQNQFGCDSIVNLDVRILRPVVIEDTIEICANEPDFNWHSFDVLANTDSIYTDTLYYAAGCDSLRLQLVLISNPVSDTIINTILCEGSPEFALNNRWIQTASSQVYLDTLIDANKYGCDSLLTYDIIVVPAVKDTLTDVTCYGEPLADWHGQSISSIVDSTYIQLLPSPSGCDTLLYYEITVLPVTDTVMDTTLCAGLPEFMWNNRLIATDLDGVYLDTLMNSYGCDSLLTYNVTILPADTISVDTLVCRGEPVFDWNMLSIQTDMEATYETTLTNSLGCDSVVILNVSIIDGLRVDTIVAACDSFTWLEGDGNTYTASGLYYYVVGSGVCADSFSLDLSISLPFELTSDITPVSCYGYSDGAIDLTMISGVSPYSYLWSTGDTTRNIVDQPAGIYTVSVTDALGCGDSLSFEITEPDSIVLAETHVDLGDSYDPIGSIDLTVVSGGTGPFTFDWNNGAISEDIAGLAAGDYTVVVTDANNCEATLTVTLTSNVVTTHRMMCLDVVEFTCFEELATYPMVDSLWKYLALNPGIEVYSDFGLDTASFASRDSVYSISPYCYTEARFYSIKDFAGNTLECTQLVIVNDNIAPTLSCPPKIVVTDGILPDPYADASEFLAAGGSMGDNCGIVSFRRVGADVSDGGSDPEIFTRTYEVKDYCGNRTTCTQRIEVYWNVEFVIACSGLPGIAYECIADLPVYRNLDDFRDAGGYANSNPFAIIDFSFIDVSDGETCPETITRTYRIENSNRDVETCSQVFVVDDKTPPVFTLPDKHIACTEPLPRVYTNGREVELSGKGFIEDNCTNMQHATVYFRSNTKLQENCPTIYERVYRVVDDCGNRTETTELIYIHDSIAPVVASTPDDIVTDCYMPEPYADYAEFVAAGGWVTDECNDFTMTHIGDSAAGPDQSGVVYRRYRFADLCSNYVDWVQKITVDDKIPPVFTQMPDVITVDCEASIFTTWTEFVSLGGWATDNCALDTTSFALVTTDADGTTCPITYRNAYEIYDMSGNRADTVHVVIVVDDEKPLLNCPPSDTIDINADFPEPIVSLEDFVFAGGTASDNCGIDSASFTLVQVDSSITECSSTVTYTFIVADNCGNWSDECSYTIYRFDDIAPEMYCITDTFIECVYDVPNVLTSYSEFVNAGGIAEDNFKLDELSFIHLGDSITGIGCPMVITRTYQIKDVCGYSVDCSYRIVVNDTIPPVMVCPSDTAIECLSNVISNIETIEEFEAAGGQLDDNCEIDSASFTSSSEMVYVPGQTKIINRFSIRDLCGNIDSCTQVITLTDTTPPIPVCNEITVMLDDEGNYILTDIDIENITRGATDNCTAEEDLIIDIDVVDFTCLDVENGKLINVVVTDEAGNSEGCMAQINVVDELPPVAICQDITVYLDANGQVSITAGMLDNGSFDNCELESIVISKDQFDCTDVGENIVELIATDVYGNQDICESIVRVIDQIPPYLTCIGKTTIQLDENANYEINWEMLTDSVWDECGIDTVLLNKYLLDCDDIGTTFITVTAYDVNGNPNTCEAEFEVFGNIPPNVLNDSALTTVNVPVAINVVANDYDLKTDIDYRTLGIEIGPSNGSVVVDTATGIVTYTPNADYVGPDVFRYSICDDAIPCEAMCEDALVFITVRPANEPPVAVDDYFDVPCGDLFGNVLLNDSDPDGDEIVAIPIPEVYPTNGTVTLFGNGNFEYIPYVDFVGVDSFQYVIHDIGVPPTLYDTAWVYITRVADNDCDGVADIDDIDDDNDGIRDIHEGDGLYDSDNDGIPDSYDIDSDNDGIPDNIEGQDEDNYINPDGWRDNNGNGWDDRYDHEEGGYPFDIALTDTDGDGIPDFLDIDSDGDGVLDYIEGHDENADGIADVVRMYADTDFDGLDDAYDTHPGWGLTDNETGSNAPLQDFDSDGVRDWRDVNDEDDEHQTIVEDINGNGDYSDDDLDLDGHPEYLDVEMDCELFIPEGFSPNDDGVHDFFQILCIYPRYPDAKLMIFNRQGQKLFEKENYGNYDVWGWDDAWWWGTTANRFTIGRSGGLPAGNYVYVLELGNGEVENGTVMVAY